MIHNNNNARNNLSLQTHNGGVDDRIMMKYHHNHHVWTCGGTNQHLQELYPHNMHLPRIPETCTGGCGGGSSSEDATTTTTISCSTSLFSSDGGISLENLSLETIPLTSTTYMSEVSLLNNTNISSIGSSSPSSYHPHSPATTTTDKRSERSVGFSELMRAADDMLGSYEQQNHHRIMTPVLEDDDENENDESRENDEWEEIIEILPPPALGMLIVPGAGDEDDELDGVVVNNVGGGGGGDNWEHHSPLLPRIQIQKQQQQCKNHQHHLSQKAMILLSQAKSHVKTTILTQDSFEVSMIMNPQCTMEDVMRILGHPDVTLTSWFEPVQELVVTSRTSTSTSSSSSSSSSSTTTSSNSSGSSKREYDGEWINGVTPAGTLIPPKSSSSSTCLHRTKDAIINMFGFSQSSCGTVNMFVDKHLGQLSFVVGPFPGDIYASHTITVVAVDVQEGSGNSSNIQVVDRVLLRQGGEGYLADSDGSHSSLVSGLGRCFLPSLSSYVEQSTSSMARLWVLVNHGETTTTNTWTQTKYK